MKFRLVLPTLLCLLFIHQLNGQKLDIQPTIAPEFFSADDEITISYDVSFTAASDWDAAWLWAWLPDNTSAAPSSNINPASSNTALSDAAKFTKVSQEGRVYFVLDIVPEDFFGTDQITSIGLLLKGDDWAEGQTEDFIAEVTNSFTVKFTQPSGDFGFYEEGESIDLEIKTSEVSDITLYLDNAQIGQVSDAQELAAVHDVISDGQVHELKATADNGEEIVETTYSYSIKPETPIAVLPEGVQDGINVIDDNTVTLVLTAPTKENVFVIGDFNDWDIDQDYLMNRDGDQFWLTISDLAADTEYAFQYLLDGEIRIADPYSEKIGSPFDDPEIIAEERYEGLRAYPSGETTEAITYFQIGKSDYEWQVVDFERPDAENLMIYELLVRDFTDERNYEAVIERLDYLKDLGINAVELLPVTEFEGNNSWGYNPAFMLAADKYYGTENQLKRLIDECHQRGIAFIADMVLNHAFGRSPLVRMDNTGTYGAPQSDNVYLNTVAKHDFNVGYDFNHESQYTQDYMDRVNRYWLEEYKVDGFRFDLSKGFTQKNTLGDIAAWSAYDASRVALLKRMAEQIHSVDESAYLILEHLADNQEETELANYGFMLWGNRNPQYRSLAKGNSRSLDDVHHDGMGWDDARLVAYMESHDEERVMWDLMKTGTRTLTESVARCQLNAAFFFTIPGPKMIWQFGEMGYDEELNDDRLGIKPTHWEYLDDPIRENLVSVYQSLMKLKTETDYISGSDYTMSSNSGVKTITLEHPDTDVIIVGNFNNETKTEEVTFTQSGNWYDYFSGENIEVDDTKVHPQVLSGGDFRMYTSQPLDNYLDTNPIITDVSRVMASDDEFNFWPNPVSDKLTLRVTGMTKLYEILDMTGRVSAEIEAQGEQVEVDLQYLSKGTYLIRPKADRVHTKVFVKY